MMNERHDTNEQAKPTIRILNQIRSANDNKHIHTNKILMYIALLLYIAVRLLDFDTHTLRVRKTAN